MQRGELRFERRNPLIEFLSQLLDLLLNLLRVGGLCRRITRRKQRDGNSCRARNEHRSHKNLLAR